MSVEIHRFPRKTGVATSPARDDLLTQTRELSSPEPPTGLWTQLRRRLEREGLIRSAPPLPSGVLPFPRREK